MRADVQPSMPPGIPDDLIPNTPDAIDVCVGGVLLSYLQHGVRADAGLDDPDPAFVLVQPAQDLFLLIQ